MLIVLNTTTPAEQESLWQLKNSWSGSKEPSQGKAVELRLYRGDGSRPWTSLGASESHCSTWYFLKMATTISFVPMLFYNVIFYSPVKRLEVESHSSSRLVIASANRVCKRAAV